MRDETAVTAASKAVEFGFYFRKDLNPLIWYGRRLGGSEPEAEDAALEAMVALWRHWETAENAAAYSREVVRRVLYRARDRARRTRAAEMRLRAAEPTGVHVDNDPFDADVQRVIAMLQALPKAQRDVFALHMDGFSAIEIAKIAEQNVATVRSNLRHARQKLIRMIGRRPTMRPGRRPTMDREDEATLQQFLDRASRSALKSLDALVDVEERLRELYRKVGHNPRTTNQTDHTKA